MTRPEEVAAAGWSAADLPAAVAEILRRQQAVAARDPAGRPGADGAGGPRRTRRGTCWSPARRSAPSRPARERVVLLCGPRGRAAADLLPGVDEIIEHPLPWIDPAPGPVDPEAMRSLTARLGAVGADEAVVFTSFHQSAAAAGAAAADGRGRPDQRDQRRLSGLAAGRPAPGAGGRPRTRTRPVAGRRRRLSRCPTATNRSCGCAGRRAAAPGRARRPRVRGAAPRVGRVEPGPARPRWPPGSSGRWPPPGTGWWSPAARTSARLTARVAGGRRHRPGRPHRPGRAGRDRRRTPARWWSATPVPRTWPPPPACRW